MACCSCSRVALGSSNRLLQEPSNRRTNSCMGLCEGVGGMESCDGGTKKLVVRVEGLSLLNEGNREEQRKTCGL